MIRTGYIQKKSLDFYSYTSPDDYENIHSVDRDEDGYVTLRRILRLIWKKGVDESTPAICSDY
jgi:hypothetical protein